MSTALSRRPPDPVAQEIRRLHEGIEASLRRSVQDAVRIGELLSQMKAELDHGEFLLWLHETVGLTVERTAQRYMQLFRWLEDIAKSDRVSDLSAAYRRVEQLQSREKSRGSAAARRREVPAPADPVVEEDSPAHVDRPAVRLPAARPPAAPDPKLTAGLDRLRAKGAAPSDAGVLSPQGAARLKEARSAADRFYELSLAGRAAPALVEAAQDLINALGALLEEINGEESS